MAWGLNSAHIKPETAMDRVRAILNTAPYADPVEVACTDLRELLWEIERLKRELREGLPQRSDRWPS